MFTARDITLYVPYYNAKATCQEVLEAVFAQTCPPAAVLVIDDGSSSPCDLPGVKILRHETNQGLAAARNTALNACQTSLLASLDADVAADPDWLKNMLAAMNSGDYAGVGGRLREKHSTSLPDRWRAIHMAQNWGDYPVLNPRFLFGSNNLFKTAALREAGGYDPALRTNNEDRTMSEKLYAMKRDLLYAPHALCYHLKKDTLQSVLRGYWQWHHAKGVTRGDYESSEGLIRRIMEVNCGIFRFRFDRDRQIAREEFLPLDAMIPWVFCGQDISFFAQRSGNAMPDFPSSQRLDELPNPLRQSLELLMPAQGPAVASPWLEEYEQVFNLGLDQFGWNAECLPDLDLWERLLEELSRENSAG
ncbi:MAG: glycosyltransferase family 2 protein [Lentisphaerota bacterium]